jgi:predicted dehydrogenase
VSKKIKIGVFGAFRGMSMIKVLAQHPDAKLVAICDKAKDLLDACSKESSLHGQEISLYEKFDSFMEHDMDAVVLANYANEHAPFAIKIMDSGRHVLSEVLPVETLSQAVALVEAVERSGKVYAYAENYCYFPATTEMKKLYRAGRIGEFLHGEGEYIHDCESIWPSITYGDRNHWRNRLYSTYYCTHSLGPIISITGTRPARITGYETPNVANMAKYGFPGGTSGLIVMQMDNKAVVKSLHGYLKREPSSIWYSLYGTKGMMETDRWDGGIERIYAFEEGASLTEMATSYRPKRAVDTALSRSTAGHGGSDFFPVHYFIQKILGRPEGSESIDVYQALDMAVPGILAYKSICDGNKPYGMPDFRNPGDRDFYRNDTFCTNPDIANGHLAPQCSLGTPEIPDSVYDNVRKTWEERDKS